MIVLTLCLLVLLSCQRRKAPEEHLIPYGYTGLVVIVYSVAHGHPRELVDGVTVFRIPDTGVLYVSFNASSGYVDSTNVKYYYEAEDGSRVRLYNVHGSSNFGVQFQGTGVRYDDEIDRQYFYEYYLVGIRDSLDISRLLNIDLDLRRVSGSAAPSYIR